MLVFGKMRRCHHGIISKQGFVFPLFIMSEKKVIHNILLVKVNTVWQESSPPQTKTFLGKFGEMWPFSCFFGLCFSYLQKVTFLIHLQSLGEKKVTVLYGGTYWTQLHPRGQSRGHTHRVGSHSMEPVRRMNSTFK